MINRQDRPLLCPKAQSDLNLTISPVPTSAANEVCISALFVFLPFFNFIDTSLTFYENMGKRIKWLILPLHESETDRHLIGLSG